MSALHHDKGNFWTKVRSSTNKISSSLANLSIRSEHDGDSPNSTLIHKALVNHYVSKNEQFPSWLGEEQEQQQQKPQRSQVHSNNSSSAQEHIRQPAQTQRFQPQQQQQGGVQQQPAGTSRFASRFANEQATKSPSRFATSNDNGANGSRFAVNGSRPSQPERSDSASGNAMRDRLKRNNYRNNFGI